MTESEILVKLRDELKEEFVTDLIPFWTEFVLDEKNGGFVGRVTWDKRKIYEADKGGILNARMLWAFSAATKHFDHPELKAAAHRTYEYFLRYFVDREYGGFFWMLDHKGNILDDRKQIYTQAFGIYGLVEYYHAFGAQEALDLAQNFYSLIEEHASDHENGGYFESFDRRWQLNEDVRLSEKDKNEPKGMNTHLHIVEAYTSLCRTAPNPELQSRLRHLIEIFFDHIVSPDYHLINFMDTDWTPKSDLVSYGHDIEASWLLMEAAEVLGDEYLIEKSKKISVSIAEAVLENGVDPDGGLINEGDSKGVHDPDKDWWPQVEAIVGFLNAYELSGDEKFLQASWNSWVFCKTFMLTA